MPITLRRISLTTSFLFILQSALSSVVSAQSAVTWEELVEKARTSNEELSASEHRFEAAAKKVSSARSPFFPQLSAVVAVNQTGSSTATPNTAQDYLLALNLTQNIFNGFQDQNTLSISRATLETATANLQAVKAKVSFDLKSAVAALIYSKSYLKLSQSIMERRELNLRLVQLRFDGGRENKGSLLLSRAYLEEAKLDYLDAEQSLIVAQAQLARVLGDEEAHTIFVTANVPIVEAPAEPDEDEFLKMVLEIPSFKIAAVDEKIAQLNISQSKAGFYPTINLTGSVGQAGPYWYPPRDQWALGANLTLPLFNGGKDYYNIQSTTATFKAATVNRTFQLKEQLVQLKNAYANYKKTIQRLRVDQAHVLAAETREKISRQKYNNGLSTFDDWDQIETELIRRQKNVIVSERDRIVSEAAWEQAQGKGVF